MSISRSKFSICLAAIAWCTTLFAKDIEVTIQTIQPDPVVGRLIGFSLTDGAALDDDSTVKRIPTEEIVRILARRPDADSRDTATIAPGLEQVLVELFRGDRFPGKIIEGRSEHFVIEGDEFGKVQLPLDSVARVLWPPGGKSAHMAAAESFFSAPAASDDLTLLTNGDVIQGFITALDSEGISVDTPNGETKVPTRVLVACRMAKSTPHAPDGLRAGILMSGGTRLTATGIDWLADGIEARLPEGEKVRLQPGRIDRMEISGGRWVWLSELSPNETKSVSMLSLDWPTMYDRNVLGAPLRVGGRGYDRGIGVHSKSEINFNLNGKFDQLVVEFGIDDDAGPLADVEVSILVDEQERLRRQDVRHRRLHGPFRINVQDARDLTLMVNFGRNGDLQDRFNWIEAGLIKTSR